MIATGFEKTGSEDSMDGSVGLGSVLDALKIEASRRGGKAVRVRASVNCDLFPVHTLGFTDWVIQEYLTSFRDRTPETESA